MPNIIECRVIRPKDRESAVLATVEILFDSGVRLVNMHLLKPREEGKGNRLKMPSVTTQTGAVIPAYNPINQETRSLMSDAAEKTLSEAVEAGTNDYTKVFQEPAADGYRKPEYSTLRLHRFPENNNPVRAVFSVTVDGAFTLNRLVVVKDPNTQMYVVRLPKFDLQHGRRAARYFRLPPEAYEDLYTLAMDAYTARPADEEPA